MNKTIQLYRTIYRFLTHPNPDNARKAVDKVIQLYDPLKERLSLDPTDMTRAELLCIHDNLREGCEPAYLRIRFALPAFADLFRATPRKSARSLLGKFFALAAPDKLLCSKVVGIRPEGKEGFATVTLWVSNPALLLRVLNLYGGEVTDDDFVISSVPRWIQDEYKSKG